MKSAQNFLFLLSHLLFCVAYFFFWGMPSYLSLPIISKVLIEVIFMVYFLLKKLLRNNFSTSFMFKLWILSFMNFWNLRLILNNLRSPHLTKSVYYLLNIRFRFFSLMDTKFLNQFILICNWLLNVLLREITLLKIIIHLSFSQIL